MINLLPLLIALGTYIGSLFMPYENTDVDFLTQKIGWPLTKQPASIFREVAPNTYTQNLNEADKERALYTRQLLNEYGGSPDITLALVALGGSGKDPHGHSHGSQSDSAGGYAMNADLGRTQAGQTIVISGLNRDMPPKEYDFMVAHELNHLKNYDGLFLDNLMTQLGKNPKAMSGLTFLPWKQKEQERQADLGGQRDYLRAGKDPSVFTEGVGSNFKETQLPNLDPRDSHYNFTERNRYLQEGLQSYRSPSTWDTLKEVLAQNWADTKASVSLGQQKTQEWADLARTKYDELQDLLKNFISKDKK